MTELRWNDFNSWIQTLDFYTIQLLILLIFCFVFALWRRTLNLWYLCCFFVGAQRFGRWLVNALSWPICDGTGPFPTRFRPVTYGVCVCMYVERVWNDVLCTWIFSSMWLLRINNGYAGQWWQTQQNQRPTNDDEKGTRQEGKKRKTGGIDSHSDFTDLLTFIAVAHTIFFTWCGSTYSYVLFLTQSHFSSADRHNLILNHPNDLTSFLNLIILEYNDKMFLFLFYLWFWGAINHWW